MKNRPLLLILVCLGLAALVWYDNQPEEGAERRVTAAAPQQAEADIGPPAAGTPESASPASGGGEQSSDNFEEQPARTTGSAPGEPGTETGASESASPDAAAAEDGGEKTASPEPQHSGNPLASHDKSTLKDWVERPLFAPSRKRPPPTEASHGVATVAAKPPPLYDLMGVVSEQGRAIALLRKKADGTSFRVQVGDMLGGWQVSKVDPRAVTLVRDDGTSETVSIFRE